MSLKPEYHHNTHTHLLLAMTTSTPGVAFSSRHLHYVGNSGSRHHPRGLVTALKLEDKIHGINIHTKVGLHLTRFKYRREQTRKALRTHLTDRSRTTLGCALGHICLHSFGVLGHIKDYLLSRGALCFASFIERFQGGTETSQLVPKYKSSFQVVT